MQTSTSTWYHSLPDHSPPSPSLLRSNPEPKKKIKSHQNFSHSQLLRLYIKQMSKTFNLMATQSLIITISCETEFYSVRESAHVQRERLGFFFSDSVSVCVFFCERERERVSAREKDRRFWQLQRSLQSAKLLKRRRHKVLASLIYARA